MRRRAAAPSSVVAGTTGAPASAPPAPSPAPPPPTPPASLRAHPETATTNFSPPQTTHSTTSQIHHSSSRSTDQPVNSREDRPAGPPHLFRVSQRHELLTGRIETQNDRIQF